MTQQEVAERIKEKLLEKAREDAKRIIEDAKREAEKIIKEAEEKWKKKVEETRRKIIEEAKREAEEILVDARIKARIRITEEKNRVIEQLLGKVEELVDKDVFNREESLRKLLEEAIKQSRLNEVVIYVSSRDIKLMQSLKPRIESGLKVKIIDIREANIKGGVIVESVDGGIRIDNSYDVRLELVKMKLLPEVSKELFSNGEDRH